MHESLGHLAYTYSKHPTRLRWGIGLEMIRDAHKTFVLTPQQRSDLEEALAECRRREAEARA